MTTQSNPEPKQYLIDGEQAKTAAHDLLTREYGDVCSQIEVDAWRDLILSHATKVEPPRLVMGDGNYSCAACGMGMKEPCEHWREMIEASKRLPVLIQPGNVLPKLSYKLPSCESGSITVSSASGKEDGSQRVVNPQSTSGVPSPKSSTAPPVPAAMSARELSKLFCEYTRNECGSDTWMAGRECVCVKCQRWLGRQEAIAALSGAGAEGPNVTSMPVNRTCRKCGWTHAVGTDCPSENAVFDGAEGGTEK